MHVYLYTYLLYFFASALSLTLSPPSPCRSHALQVPKGSVLFLNNLIPHRSLNNMSDHIRWSFDLRFQRPDEPVGFCMYCAIQDLCFRFYLPYRYLILIYSPTFSHVVCVRWNQGRAPAARGRSSRLSHRLGAVGGAEQADRAARHAWLESRRARARMGARTEHRAPATV